MKLATFTYGGEEGWGLVLANEADGQEWVYEPEKCEAAFRRVANGTSGYYRILPEFMPGRKWPKTLIDFLRLGDDGMERLKRFETFLTRYLRQSDPYYISCIGHPLSQVRLRMPLPQSGLFLGLVANSVSFWRSKPERRHVNLIPQAHQRPVTSVIGSGEMYCGRPGGNVELGIVIGKDCYCVSIDEAYDYVAGFVVVFDSEAQMYFSEFDKGVDRTKLFDTYTDWFADATCSWLGKGADSYCICGPYLTTKDEVGNPYDLLVWTKTNGVQRDRSSTAGYSLGVERTVHFFSQFMTLHPGDIIHMGTVGTDGIAVDTSVMPFGQDGSIGAEIECLGEISAHVHCPEMFGDTRTERMREIPLVPATQDMLDGCGSEITGDKFRRLFEKPSDGAFGGETGAAALTVPHSVWTCYGNFASADQVLGFHKAPSPRMLNGPRGQIVAYRSLKDDTLILSPIAEDLELSVEVALIVKRMAKNIREEEAADYILGYTTVLSVRDKSLEHTLIEPATGQEKGVSEVYGRWGDGYNTLGELTVGARFGGRRMRLTVEGIGSVLANTDEYTPGPERCLAFLSIGSTVLPGDVILLGRIGETIQVPKEAVTGGLKVEAEVEGFSCVRRTLYRPS